MPKSSSKRRLQHQASTKDAQGPNVPAPFIHAPESLEPFLSALDPAQVYIVHVDALPLQFKRKIFAVPVFLNIGIALLLAWRLYKVLPTYLNLLMISMGLPSPETVDKTGKSNRQLGNIVLKRVAMILLDFILFRFIGAWPLMFFFEQPVSPALWRWRLGFKDSEVVVRVSRKWGAEEFWESTKSIRGREITPTNPILRERILPAIDKEWMRERTGYMMMGRDYDLDLPAMLDAEQMLKNEEAKITDFAKAVFIYLEGRGWCIWTVEEEDNTEVSTTDSAEEEARKKMLVLKERLAALGKERLFFRWIELIQYESEQPGGLSSTRHAEIVQKARNLFDQDGVTFDELLTSVGGTQNFPGLEVST